MVSVFGGVADSDFGRVHLADERERIHNERYTVCLFEVDIDV